MALQRCQQMVRQIAVMKLRPVPITEGEQSWALHLVRSPRTMLIDPLSVVLVSVRMLVRGR